MVVRVLLRVAGYAALEAVLPELSEPRIPGVGVQAQLQEVFVKRRHFLRLQLYSDPSVRFLLVSLHHLVTICPSITDKQIKRDFQGSYRLIRRYTSDILYYISLTAIFSMVLLSLLNNATSVRRSITFVQNWFNSTINIDSFVYRSLRLKSYS